MTRLSITLCFCILLGANVTRAAPLAPVDEADAAIIAGKQPLPGLRLELSTPRKEHPQGEPIEVTMRYNYTGERKLSVLVVKFDRSGRVQEYGFNAVDANGQAVRDPVARLGDMGGGQRWEAALAAEQPFEQQVTLNEWLAFDRPGRYTIKAHSKIVRLGASAYSGPGIPLESAPLEIEITAPDEASRRARLARAQTELPLVDQQARVDIMRDLRFMLDERAIPLLARGLEDEWINVVFQARFGLLAFLDLAPVKTELLRVVNEATHFVMLSRMREYLDILSEADRRAGKGPPPQPWHQLLTAKFNQKMATLPPAKAAVATVDGMKSYQLKRVVADHWKLVLNAAESMPRRPQEDAAELLLHQIAVDPKRDTRLEGEVLASLRPSLKTAALNEKVNGSLRLAALVALHAVGDDSLRDLLAEDIMSPQTKLLRSDAGYGRQWEAVLSALGDYRATEIAHKLLEMLPSAGTPAGGNAASILRRLGDFSRGASVEELQEALRWVMAKWPGSQEPLLTALTLKSPEAAVPFIRDLPRPTQPGDQLRSNAISKLLARMDNPAARTLIKEIFDAPNEEDRISLAHGFAIAVQQADEGDHRASTSRLSPRPDLARSYFLEILKIFQSDASPRLRAQARYALGAYSGIPDHGVWAEVSAQDAQLIPKWEAWWKENHARFGR